MIRLANRLQPGGARRALRLAQRIWFSLFVFADLYDEMGMAVCRRCGMLVRYVGAVLLFSFALTNTANRLFALFGVMWFAQQVCTAAQFLK